MPEARLKSGARAQAKSKSKQPQPEPGSRWWIYAFVLAGAVFIAFQVYQPALNGPFVFDDTHLPYGTPDYPNNLRAWISSVRPLLMATYWLNVQISTEPAAFHIVNVLLHLLNSLLVFFIVRKLLSLSEPQSPGSRPSARGPLTTLLAGFAAAVFLLHPVQTESVSYIAGRSEILSVLFLLAAFAVFLYRRSAGVSWSSAIVILALFGAAVASKEHTVALVALLLLTDYYWNPGFSFAGIRRNWRLYLPIAVGSLAGVAFVARVLAGSPSAGFGIKDFTWYQYFFTQCRAFFAYLRLFLFPAGLDLDYDFPISRNLLDHGAAFSLIAILMLVAAAIYFRRRFPLLSYGFLVYVLLLAPTSSFVPIKDPFAERRLYLPMIGLLLVAVAVLQRTRWDWRKLAAGLAGGVAVLAFVTWQHNQVWASDIALWEDTVSKSPGKARAHFQLAHTYYSNGRCQDALAQYAETARLQPPSYDLFVDWGLAYDCTNQLDEAVAKLRQAAALQATAHVYSQMGMVYAKRARWPEALDALALAEKLDSTFPAIFYYRGGIRAKTNDFAAAEAEYKHALALDPSMEPARQGLLYVQQRLRAPR